MTPAKCCAHSPVAIAAVITLKDFGHGKACIGVFIRHSQLGAVIEVGAARQVQFSKEFCKHLIWTVCTKVSKDATVVHTKNSGNYDGYTGWSWPQEAAPEFFI